MTVHAMPVMLGVLAILAIAYRYYSAFLAARVAALDDSRTTPAHRINDGQNYHPTNSWVLFGHHFAAISGAGPLIGPVLAIQYGYMPGLIWLVVGVCLAGAVQDMLVLAASVRRGGKSLAEIARAEIGPAGRRRRVGWRSCSSSSSPWRPGLRRGQGPRRRGGADEGRHRARLSRRREHRQAHRTPTARRSIASRPAPTTGSAPRPTRRWTSTSRSSSPSPPGRR